MSKTIRRQPKSVRLVDQEVALLAAIHQALPHHTTESDVLAEAVHIGLLVLAAEAVESGQSIGELPTVQLVQRLRVRLLPVFELLVREGALPALLMQRGGSAPLALSGGAAEPVPAPPPLPSKPSSVSQRAAAAVQGLGSGFLADDDDD